VLELSSVDVVGAVVAVVLVVIGPVAVLELDEDASVDASLLDVSVPESEGSAHARTRASDARGLRAIDGERNAGTAAIVPGRTAALTSK
jgi:hypothetical protein